MISQEVAVINRLGLHARAAAKFVDCAARFSSKVTVAKDTQVVDAKSIMSVMMLAAGKGSTLTLTAEGTDAQQAIDALVALIQDRFGEAD